MAGRVVLWSRRPGEQVEAACPTGVVDGVADAVPEVGGHLPLVEEDGRGAIEQVVGIEFD
jgi:hypothetical protein